MTSLSQKEKMDFYESIAEDFDRIMNMYDLRKRVEVVYESLLQGVDLKGKKLLDAGCGTGWFSKAGVERGANVVSMDVGVKLMQQVQKKCASHLTVGSILELPFRNHSFDVIVSSEVLEHIPNAAQALKEFHRVLKPGGILAFTTPNKNWYFAIWIANTFRLRPYRGLENWLSWKELKSSLVEAGFVVDFMEGFHLFPFIVPALNPLLNYLDRFGKKIGPLMLNTAVKATSRRYGQP